MPGGNALIIVGCLRALTALPRFFPACAMSAARVCCVVGTNVGDEGVGAAEGAGGVGAGGVVPGGVVPGGAI